MDPETDVDRIKPGDGYEREDKHGSGNERCGVVGEAVDDGIRYTYSYSGEEANDEVDDRPRRVSDEADEADCGGLEVEELWLGVDGVGVLEGYPVG